MAREKKKTPVQNSGIKNSVSASAVSESPMLDDHSISLCIPAADMMRLRPILDGCGVAAVTIESIWNGAPDGVNSGAQSLQHLPARLLGFLSSSDSGAQDVERFRSIWAGQFKREAPAAMVIHGIPDAVAILQWIARALVNAQHQMARRNTDLMRDMFAVRADHEAMQEAFHKLESYAYATSMLSRHLALCLEPQKTLVKLTRSPAGFSRQLLPMSSAGISDVAVHIGQMPKDLEGRLDATLITLEDGQTVCQWSLPASHIRPGWLQFGLGQALGVDERSIALQLQWIGSGDIGLTLSSQHPEARWCVAAAGKAAGAPLAMKVWRSFPGTRAVPAAHSTMNASSEQEMVMLYADTLRKVENLGAIPDGIAFDEHWNSLLVHPVAGRITWARVNGAVPAGVSRISADVETRNEKAGPVEYAIAIAPATDKARKAQSLHFKPGQISEWILVGTSVQSQVHLNLASALAADCDLYLGTRLPAGASNAFCWAHFSKIKMSR